MCFRGIGDCGCEAAQANKGNMSIFLAQSHESHLNQQWLAICLVQRSPVTPTHLFSWHMINSLHGEEGRVYNKQPFSSLNSWSWLNHYPGVLAKYNWRALAQFEKHWLCRRIFPAVCFFKLWVKPVSEPWQNRTSLRSFLKGVFSLIFSISRLHPWCHRLLPQLHQTPSSAVVGISHTKSACRLNDQLFP